MDTSEGHSQSDSEGGAKVEDQYLGSGGEEGRVGEGSGLDDEDSVSEAPEGDGRLEGDVAVPGRANEAFEGFINALGTRVDSQPNWKVLKRFLKVDGRHAPSSKRLINNFYRGFKSTMRQRVKYKWSQLDKQLLVWVVSKYAEIASIDLVVNDRLTKFDGAFWEAVARVLDADMEGIRKQWQKLQPMTSRKVCWSEAEDEVIRRHAQRSDFANNWSQLSDAIYQETGVYRMPKQVRGRWLNALNPEIKKDVWTPAEDTQLLRRYLEIGKRWAFIAQELDGRNENQVKNRYYSIIKKNLDSFPEDTEDEREFMRWLRIVRQTDQDPAPPMLLSPKARTSQRVAHQDRAQRAGPTTSPKVPLKKSVDVIKKSIDLIKKSTDLNGGKKTVAEGAAPSEGPSRGGNAVPASAEVKPKPEENKPQPKKQPPRPAQVQEFDILDAREELCSIGGEEVESQSVLGEDMTGAGKNVSIGAKACAAFMGAAAAAAVQQKAFAHNFTPQPKNLPTKPMSRSQNVPPSGASAVNTAQKITPGNNNSNNKNSNNNNNTKNGGGGGGHSNFSAGTRNYGSNSLEGSVPLRDSTSLGEVLIPVPIRPIAASVPLLNSIPSAVLSAQQLPPPPPPPNGYYFHHQAMHPAHYQAYAAHNPFPHPQAVNPMAYPSSQHQQYAQPYIPAPTASVMPGQYAHMHHLYASVPFMQQSQFNIPATPLQSSISAMSHHMHNSLNRQ